MTPPTGYTEDALIEQPAVALLAALGWGTVNAYHEFDHGASALGRETRAEIWSRHWPFMARAAAAINLWRTRPRWWRRWGRRWERPGVCVGHKG